MKIISKILFFSLAALIAASCSKKSDGTDLSDGDEVGEYAIIFDRTTIEGTEVFNAATMGVRAISAEKDGFSMEILFDEEIFKTGTTFTMGDNNTLLPVISYDYDNDGEENVFFGMEGTVKVISISKIELDLKFYEQMYADSEEHKVTGYISSN